jgi:CheY-like chemotaxis protein
MPKAKILIVDDDPDFVEYTRSVLESNDYRIVSAGNGDQGMLVLTREKPDLVILDVIIPGAGRPQHEPANG